MSFILNLSILPLLGLIAVVLMYSQIGFIIAIIIAVRQSFKNIKNIKNVILYMFLMLIAAGIAFLIMKLTIWVSGFANYKMWGYITGAIISLFTSWKIIPEFIKVALEQTDRRNYNLR